MMKVSDVRSISASWRTLVASSQAAMKAGKTVDEAFAAFSLAKYPGYKNERVKAAIQAIYDETKVGKSAQFWPESSTASGKCPYSRFPADLCTNVSERHIFLPHLCLAGDWVYISHRLSRTPR